MKTLTANQIADMLDAQVLRNQAIHPEWRQHNLDWNRAIIVKAAAAMSSYGWSLAGYCPPNMQSVQKLLKEIWGCNLSIYLEDNENFTITEVSQIIFVDLAVSREATTNDLAMAESLTESEYRELVCDLFQEMISTAAAGEYCVGIVATLFSLLRLQWSAL